MSYTNTFGGSTVAAANPSFTALTLSANTVLVWPLESTGGVPFVASWMNVTATAAGLQLQMPPANTGSTGVAAIIANVGTNSFIVTDTAGDQIIPIAAGQVWVIVLTNNTTTDGLWTSAQLASTTSVATAAALAGLGLQASGAQLQVNWPAVESGVATTISAANRSNVIIYNGTVGGGVNFSINASSTLGSGFICAISNESATASNLTLTSNAGELFNGQTSFVMTPGLAAFLICYIVNGVGAFVVIGSGGVFPSLTIAEGLFTVDTSGNTTTAALQANGVFSAQSGAFSVGTINSIAGSVTAGSVIIPLGGPNGADLLTVECTNNYFTVANTGAVGCGNLSCSVFNSSSSVEVGTCFIAGTAGGLVYAGSGIGSYYQMQNQQFQVFVGGPSGGGAIFPVNPFNGQMLTVVNMSGNNMIVAYTYEGATISYTVTSNGHSSSFVWIGSAWLEWASI